MKKISLSKDDIILFYRLKLISEIQTIKRALETFQVKYKQDFEKFEKEIHKKQNENFSEWDDYLEWKSFWQLYQDKQRELEELEHEANIEIITE